MPSSRRRAPKLLLVASIAAAVDVRRCTRPRPLTRRALPAAIDVKRQTAPVAPRLLARRALPGAVAAIAFPVAASDLLDVCPTCDQPVDALPLATIRGKWSLDAQWTEDGLPRALRGTVAFRALRDDRGKGR